MPSWFCSPAGDWLFVVDCWVSSVVVVGCAVVGWVVVGWVFVGDFVVVVVCAGADGVLVSGLPFASSVTDQTPATPCDQIGFSDTRPLCASTQRIVPWWFTAFQACEPPPCDCAHPVMMTADAPCPAANNWLAIAA